MEKRLKAIATKLWPEIETMSGHDYVSGLFNVTGFLYAAPLALAGLGWLIAVTDLALMRTEWPMLSFLLVLLFIFERLHFYFFAEIMPGIYANWQASFTSVIIWSAALLFGRSGLWLAGLYQSIYYARRWWRYPSTERRWNCARNFAFNLVEILTSLIALTLYAHWAGSSTPSSAFPLPGLALDSILPAFFATFVWWLLPALVWVPILIVFGRFRPSAFALTEGSQGAHVRFWAWALGWPVLVGPFAVLAAGLHAQNGVGGYLFFVSGLLLTSLLAHHLSQAVERSQQRSRELEKLEQLGRAVLNAPPDASTLPDVLREHASDMFSRSQIEIRMGRSPLFPDQTILHYPDNWPPVSAPIWEWQRANPETRHFPPKTGLPWGEQLDADTAVVLAPILDAENSEPLGGIYLARRWDPDAIARLMPAVQSLAAQIASALHRAEVYRIEQEMAVAGKIQASFLPDSTPHVLGWQLAATLEPARETSGDFYDFIPLPDGRLGILIADVADKGTGAALYMAASRTLIRTYAAEYDTQPELALGAANRRILADTRADLFVSVFYGVLDSTAGTLTYCNAGHNPPYLFSAQNGSEAQPLTKTGMVLGVIEDVTWEQRTIHLASGDLLVLYTDGVTDAENGQGVFFGEERLLETIKVHRERPAQDVQDALMAEIHKFVGAAPQFDDITLMIVRGEN